MADSFAGRYELVELIGDGATGSVWLARDLKTNQHVAAKVLRHADAASLLRFVREQGMRINHPHVMTPLGWIGSDEGVLFTMPLIAGGSVTTLIGDYGALPPLLVAELIRQAAGALVAVHGAGIVHRDVKPSNLLLAPTGAGRPHLYLADFSISVDLSGPRLTSVGIVLGTPNYMAPEQWTDVEVGPAVDVYSLGLVALVMLTGVTPPAQQGSPPPHTPEPLARVVRQMLAQDPASRPTAAAVLAELSVPELGWRPEAAGDVEVLHQVGTQGDDRTHVHDRAATPIPPHPAHATVVPRVQPPAPMASRPQGKLVAGIPMLAWGIAGLLIAGAGVLIALLFLP